MPNREDVDYQLNMLNIHRRNIQQYLKNIGILGNSTPPHVYTSLSTERAKVSRIKNILNNWGVDVEDHVDDTEAVLQIKSSIPVGTKIKIEVDNDNKILVMPKEVYAVFEKAMRHNFGIDLSEFVIE